MTSALEHPDLCAAARTGFPSFQFPDNRDTPENRADYIEEHIPELVRWLELGHREILEEFLQFSVQICSTGYEEWLN